MKTLILALFLLVAPFQAYAVRSTDISQAISAAETVKLHDTFLIAVAIEKILEADPFFQHRVMTNAAILKLAKDVEKASKVSGRRWELLLAISYVESNLCDEGWLKGDKKLNRTGKKLIDYDSIGCMQVNLKWWGEEISKAGLQQQDLLDSTNGIIIGALILTHKVDVYGWEEGIKRYNGIGIRAENYRTRVLTVLNLIA